MLFKAIEILDVAVLWIDAISVPISQTLERKAVSKLREVFTMAKSVLVIDRRLMNVGGHWMERRLEVLASEWMGRLWTLQEGHFASELYFQFKNEAIPGTGLVKVYTGKSVEDLASLSPSFAYTSWENI